MKRVDSARNLVAAMVICVTCVSLTGCDGDIDRTYGKLRGEGAISVNGTNVLAGMFEEAGFKVSSWKRLSPRLEQAQVIVWAPDSFSPPQLDERRYLENWLRQGDGRTIVFIGRDYDAAPVYWRKMQPLAPLKQQEEVANRRAKTQADHDTNRSGNGPQYARWFKWEPKHRLRTVNQLEGPWAAEIDASQVEIQLEGRFVIPTEADLPANAPPPTTPATTPAPATTPPPAPPATTPKSPAKKTRKRSGGGVSQNPVTGPVFNWIDEEINEEPNTLPDFETLLSSGDDIIVSQLTSDDWGDGQIIVVTNGSFLLNLPLVNREHRKLASRLIEACGPPSKTVFLESGHGGLPIRNSEPDHQPPTGIGLFTVPPINVVLLHLVAIGVVYCCCQFPIFGRARRLPPDAVSDFSSHIAAMGELLEQTQDRAYAQERLAYYHAHVKRDSGVSHKKK